MTLDKKLKKIADYYGLEVQLNKLAEECAEYAAASLKWQWYWDHMTSRNYAPCISKAVKTARETKINELGDVLLLAIQVEYLLDTKPDLKEEIRKNMEFKADRQLKRIKQYKKESEEEQQRLEEEANERYD